MRSPAFTTPKETMNLQTALRAVATLLRNRKRHTGASGFSYTSGSQFKKDAFANDPRTPPGAAGNSAVRPPGKKHISLRSHGEVSVPVEILFAPQSIPNVAASRILDGENVYRDSADLCSPDQVCATPFKMIAPTIFSRVKQPNDFTGCRVPACNIRPLSAVAVSACESQIVQGGLATVLRGQNMINMEWSSVYCSRDMAVFAPPVCAILDASYQALVHAVCSSRGRWNPAPRSATRAWECMIVKRLAM